MHYLARPKGPDVLNGRLGDDRWFVELSRAVSANMHRDRSESNRIKALAGSPESRHKSGWSGSSGLVNR